MMETGEDGLAGKVLARQAGGLGSDPQKPHQKLGVVHALVISVLGGGKRWILCHLGA